MTWFGIYLQLALVVSLGSVVAGRAVERGPANPAVAVLVPAVVAGLVWPVVLLGVLQVALVAAAHSSAALSRADR